MSGSILAHFFTKDEKITFLKSIGILSWLFRSSFFVF